MNILRIKSLIKQYIWLILPLGFIVFFLGLILVGTMLPQSKERVPDNTITTTPNVSDKFVTPTTAQLITETPLFGEEDIHGEEFNPEEEEQTYGLLNKETLQDGTLRYSYASYRSDRPDLIISDTANEVLFERIVAEPGHQYFVNDFLDFYGQPELLLTGSQYYGENAKTYIFAKRGAAIIVNPQAQLVLEYHRFPPMTTEDYLRKYGEDIVNK